MLQSEHYELETRRVRVIENKNWSETHVSGGGGGSGPFGHVHINSVKSHSVDRQALWVEDETGHQFELEARGKNVLSCRVGHQLVIFYMHAKRMKEGLHMVAVYNATTGTLSKNDGVYKNIRLGAYSFSWFNLFMFCAGIFVINVLRAADGPQFWGPAMMMIIPCIIFGILRYRPLRKECDRLFKSALDDLKAQPLQKAPDSLGLQAATA